MKRQPPLRRRPCPACERGTLNEWDLCDRCFVGVPHTGVHVNVPADVRAAAVRERRTDYTPTTDKPEVAQPKYRDRYTFARWPNDDDY